MNENIFGKIQEMENRTRYMQHFTQGVRHHNRLDPTSPTAEDRPLVTVTSALAAKVSQITCEIITPEKISLPLTRIETKWDLFNWRYYHVWQAALPAYPDGTLVRYQIKASAERVTEPILADGGEIFGYLVGHNPTPQWAREAVIYQIFPDRFYHGDGQKWNQTNNLRDIHGGTIRGIIEKLDHVIDLGFNAIWLNPFFPADTHHNYNATDYFQVDPRMGSMDDIKELVETAHENGIRLILDFVANHWSRKHPFFRTAQQDKSSDYYHWFTWKQWPDDYETYFTVKELPKINVDYPPARQHLFDSVRFWLTEVGFDGLRLDHANGPNLEFWAEFFQFTLALKPDVWIFGEVVEPAPNLLPYYGRMHGCLDFPLLQALRDTFALGTMDIQTFDSFLSDHEAFFPEDYSRPAFLDNHDMDRFSWAAGNDPRKLKLASLVLFTLPHPPIVYYGTEVGLIQSLGKNSPGSLGWEECRAPMIWDSAQNQELIDYFRWLVSFRKFHPVIWQGQRSTLHVDGERGTYAFAITNADETILVALNLSDNETAISLDEASFTFQLGPWEGKTHLITNRQETT